MKNDWKCDQNATEMRPSGEPLTLEQLREMNTNPVWIERKGDRNLRDSGWAMVNGPTCLTYIENVPVSWSIIVYWPGSEEEDFPEYEDYGKTWLAYAYPPAYIDLEAWEPCPLCGEYKVFQFLAWETSDRCLGNPDCMGTSLFCPHCGRPLTPEAWELLEKRLRGFEK